jgi:hypothetical protein
VSLGLGVAIGARRNGPVRPHVQRTGVRRQHTCSAMLPRQRIGSEVVATCLCSDKIKYNMAVAYIYMKYMAVTLAIKIMALHSTPLEPLSHAQGMH